MSVVYECPEWRVDASLVLPLWFVPPRTGSSAVLPLHPVRELLLDISLGLAERYVLMAYDIFIGALTVLGITMTVVCSIKIARSKVYPVGIVKKLPKK